MRAFIKFLDHLIRRASGVFEFTDDPECIFRVQIAPAPHPVTLSDGTHIPAGAPVLWLHLWNEHVPRIGPAGPDLSWALRTERMLLRSLRRLAEWMSASPQASAVQAIGGITVLASPAGDAGGERLLRRLGFELHPHRNPLGRFGEFWENLYTWWLMWSFNPASLRGAKCGCRARPFCRAMPPPLHLRRPLPSTSRRTPDFGNASPMRSNGRPSDPLPAFARKTNPIYYINRRMPGCELSAMRSLLCRELCATTGSTHSERGGELWQPLSC